MKNRYIALALGLMMVCAPCAAMAEEAASPDIAVEQSTEVTTAQTAVYGQVVSVQEDSITIAVGTMKEMQGGGQPGGEQPGGDGGEMPSGEQQSMLDLTGEEQTIAITEDTVITKNSMGGNGGASGDMMQKPEGEAGDAAPEKPEGEAGDAAPEKPEGEEGDAAPEMPSEEGGAGQPGMEGESIALSDLAEGDLVAVMLDDDGTAVSVTLVSFDGNGGMGMNGGFGGNGGGSGQPESYTAVNEYIDDAEVEGETITSTGSDENAVLVEDGAEVTLSDTVIDRTSSDSTGGDASSFYGVGAAVLATNGNAYVTDSTITTDSAGGAGLFAYGDGTVYAADSVISTQQDTSGGIHAAGGGTLYAWNLDVTTNGGSAAAIRSDRGGGTMVVDGGTYTSNGVGSPAVYCTADIAVSDAELTATGSEAVCIEGLNTLKLFDCDLSGTMSDSSQNDCTWTVIVYQSMSGDSEVGNGTFEMNGGSLTSGNGGLFYTTNTECTITLQDVAITPSDTNAFFLRCTGNNNQRGWGQSGANGSDCLFTAISQEMTGDIIWDSISQLDFYMTDGSTLTGAITDDETYAGEGGSGFANLYIDADSSWIVTGDSTLSVLCCEGTITDEEGNTVSVIGTDGEEYVSGDSAYTITVDSYSDLADFSGASTPEEWSDYEAEMPSTM